MRWRSWCSRRTVSHPLAERGQYLAGGEVAVADDWPVAERAAERHGRHGVDRAQQLAQLAGWREVFVLVGDPHLLDPVYWRQPGDDGVDQLLRGRGAGGDADRAAEVGGPEDLRAA